MLKRFLPANLKRVIVYSHPINVRWGTAKLRALCRDELGIEPNDSTAFLFANKTQDCLLLYSPTPRPSCSKAIADISLPTRTSSTIIYIAAAT